MNQRRFDAVIFDFGGVITASPFEAFNRLEAERGLPQNFIRSVNAANPDSNAWALFERAEIDAATFDIEGRIVLTADEKAACAKGGGCVVLTMSVALQLLEMAERPKQCAADWKKET